MPLINLVDLLTCVLVKLTHSKSKLCSPCWTTPPVSLSAPEPLRLREAVAIKCCASTALVPAHHHLCQQQCYRLLLWERKVCVSSFSATQVPSGPLRPRKRPRGRQSARPLEPGHGARGDGEGRTERARGRSPDAHPDLG